MTPQRMCIGCRAVSDKASLVRLVWNSTSGLVETDVHQRKPGRGCYLHPECVEVALKRRAVGRALRVSVDPVQVAAALEALRAD